MLVSYVTFYIIWSTKNCVSVVYFIIIPYPNNTCVSTHKISYNINSSDTELFFHSWADEFFGETLAVCQSSGISPLSSDNLIFLVKIGAILDDCSLSRL